MYPIQRPALFTLDQPAPERPPRRWSERLPQWVHLAPHVALAVLGGVLLCPNIVPAGPPCGEDITTTASAQPFIQISAVLFGLVAGLLLLSAVVASAQRRGGRPGAPTLVLAVILGAVAITGMLSPHGAGAEPAEIVMTLDVFALFGTGGLALIVPLVGGLIAWRSLRGPRSLRAAQIADWTVLLTALPAIMAWTYLTVTPICMN